jgi:hypothetical protein
VRRYNGDEHKNRHEVIHLCHTHSSARENPVKNGFSFHATVQHPFDYAFPSVLTHPTRIQNALTSQDSVPMTPPQTHPGPVMNNNHRMIQPSCGPTTIVQAKRHDNATTTPTTTGTRWTTPTIKPVAV